MWHVLERGQVHTGLWYGHLSERDQLDDLSLDVGLILKWILKKCDGGMDWIDLAQDSDRLRALVDEAMNLRFP